MKKEYLREDFLIAAMEESYYKLAKKRTAKAITENLERTTMKQINYCEHHITDADVQAISETAKSGYITRGPKTKQFEDAVKEFIGCDHVLAVNNGTSALYIAYRFLKESGQLPDRPIRIPENTFCATWNTAAMNDIHFEVVGCDSKSGLIEENECCDNPYVFVSFGGQGRMHPIYNNPLLEDAAHAFGSYYPWDLSKRVGSAGWLTTFSFHPTKIITGGELGCICFNGDKSDLEYMRTLRDSGRSKNGDLFSLNFHPSDIHCALALSQMERVDDVIADRKRKHKVYKDELKGSKFEVVDHLPGSNHAYSWAHHDKIREKGTYQNIINIKSPRLEMKKQNIYSPKMYLGEFEKYNVILPNHQNLTYPEMERVIDCLKVIYGD